MDYRMISADDHLDLQVDDQPARAHHPGGMEIYSPVVIFVWDAALKNYGPNLGYDYGGRLVAAWLDR